MLLQSQSLTIERPQRGPGILTGAAGSALALALAIGLLAESRDWPVSLTQFLAYVGAGILALLAGLFAFWTYGCLSLTYRVDSSGVTIRWGALRHFISIDHIHALVRGEESHQPEVHGLNWWGHHVGRGHAQDLGRVLFFSTHRSPKELVYIQTSEATYGVSPQDAGRFIMETERFRSAGRPGRGPSVHRQLVAAHPIWTDRTAQLLAIFSVLLNLVVWGYVFSAYPGLAERIKMALPPIGDITSTASRDAIFKIPATATAILAVNFLAGLGFQWREKAATYLLLSGGAFFQVVFLVAAAVVVAKA